MLTKPPYPTLKHFILALQNHEQTIMVQKQEDVTLVNQNQAFFGARGRGRNQRGGRNGGRGRGFVQNGGGPNKNGSHSYQNENKVINSKKKLPQMLKLLQKAMQTIKKKKTSLFAKYVEKRATVLLYVGVDMNIWIKKKCHKALLR